MLQISCWLIQILGFVISYCISNLNFKMVIPPQYSDLGKSAKDLFEKGFSKLLVVCNIAYFFEGLLYLQINVHSKLL